MSDNNIVFAKTRHHYQSYTDYWRLVELSGFDTCYVNEIDPDSDNTYIVTPDNDEVRNAGWPKAPRAQIIHWDLEWRLQPIEPIPGVRRYWHMDKFVADRIGVQYAPMGGHAGLREDGDAYSQRYDVAFLGYMVPRRQAIADALRSNGYTVSPSDGWGSDRHAILTHSFTYLHIHQLEQIPGVPALRLVVAAAYKLPFLSEYIEEPGIFKAYLGSMVHSYSYFMESDALSLPVDSRDAAHNLHRFLCDEFTFRKSVEAAV